MTTRILPCAVVTVICPLALVVVPPAIVTLAKDTPLGSVSLLYRFPVVTSPVLEGFVPLGKALSYTSPESGRNIAYGSLYTVTLIA